MLSLASPRFLVMSLQQLQSIVRSDIKVSKSPAYRSSKCVKVSGALTSYGGSAFHKSSRDGLPSICVAISQCRSSDDVRHLSERGEPQSLVISAIPLQATQGCLCFVFSAHVVPSCRRAHSFVGVFTVRRRQLMNVILTAERPITPSFQDFSLRNSREGAVHVFVPR